MKITQMQTGCAAGGIHFHHNFCNCSWPSPKAVAWATRPEFWPAAGQYTPAIGGIASLGILNSPLVIFWNMVANLSNRVPLLSFLVVWGPLVMVVGGSADTTASVGG